MLQLIINEHSVKPFNNKQMKEKETVMNITFMVKLNKVWFKDKTAWMFISFILFTINRYTRLHWWYYHITNKYTTPREYSRIHKKSRRKNPMKSVKRKLEHETFPELIYTSVRLGKYFRIRFSFTIKIIKADGWR